MFKNFEKQKPSSYFIKNALSILDTNQTENSRSNNNNKKELNITTKSSLIEHQIKQVCLHNELTNDKEANAYSLTNRMQSKLKNIQLSSQLPLKNIQTEFSKVSQSFTQFTPVDNLNRKQFQQQFDNCSWLQKKSTLNSQLQNSLNQESQDNSFQIKKVPLILYNQPNTEYQQLMSVFRTKLKQTFQQKVEKFAFNNNRKKEVPISQNSRTKQEINQALKEAEEILKQIN